MNSLPSPNSEKSDTKTEHVDEPKEETVNENPKIPEEVKEFGVCQEIIVSTNSNVDEQIDNGDQDEEEDKEREEEEKEVEKKNVDVKEMNVAKEDSNNRVGGVEVNKFSQFHNRAAPTPSPVRKISPPVIKRATSVYTVPPRTGFDPSRCFVSSASVFVFNFNETSVFQRDLQRKKTTLVNHRANCRVWVRFLMN